MFFTVPDTLPAEWQLITGALTTDRMSQVVRISPLTEPPSTGLCPHRKMVLALLCSYLLVYKDSHRLAFMKPPFQVSFHSDNI